MILCPSCGTCPEPQADEVLSFWACRCQDLAVRLDEGKFTWMIDITLSPRGAWELRVEPDGSMRSYRTEDLASRGPEIQILTGPERIQAVQEFLERALAEAVLKT